MNSIQSMGDLNISGKNIAIIPYSTLSRIKDKIENRSDMDKERLRQEVKTNKFTSENGTS